MEWSKRPSSGGQTSVVLILLIIYDTIHRLDTYNTDKVNSTDGHTVPIYNSEAGALRQYDKPNSPCSPLEILM